MRRPSLGRGAGSTSSSAPRGVGSKLPLPFMLTCACMHIPMTHHTLLQAGRDDYSYRSGGFGGGAGCQHEGGGGGGYSGGGGGRHSHGGGGGGGSYVAGIDQQWWTGGNPKDNGYASIMFMGDEYNPSLAELSFWPCAKNGKQGPSEADCNAAYQWQPEVRAPHAPPERTPRALARLSVFVLFFPFLFFPLH